MLVKLSVFIFIASDSNNIVYSKEKGISCPNRSTVSISQTQRLFGEDNLCHPPQQIKEKDSKTYIFTLQEITLLQFTSLIRN